MKRTLSRWHENRYESLEKWLPEPQPHAYWIPIEVATCTSLASLADDHAEPELAIHLMVVTDKGSRLEWFDLPSDPISVSFDAEEVALKQFAVAIGGEYQRVERGV